MDVRYYPVQVDTNSGVIIHSEQGVDTYAEAEQRVYEGNAQDISVGYPQSWEVVMVERGTLGKFYFLGQQVVSDISWRILSITADDRIHEIVLRHTDPLDTISTEADDELERDRYYRD